MKTVFGAIMAGIVGLMLAVWLAGGVEVEGNFREGAKIILLAGGLLGLINFFLKPLINIITLPLRWLTLGLFGWAVNILIIWAIEAVFSPSLTIEGIRALLLTAVLVWAVNLLTPQKKLFKRKKT